MLARCYSLHLFYFKVLMGTPGILIAYSNRPFEYGYNMPSLCEVREKSLASHNENDGSLIKFARHSSRQTTTGSPQDNEKNILRCQKPVRFMRFGSKVCILSGRFSSSECRKASPSVGNASRKTSPFASTRRAPISSRTARCTASSVATSSARPTKPISTTRLANT